MPTYDYECDKCGYEFERFQSMTEDPIKICPECNANGVRRLLGTGAGIIFKGSGFYETDYKRQPERDKSKQESKQESKSDSKSDSKQETSSGGEKKQENKSDSKSSSNKEAAA